jgi:predicted transposase/invertase (TIGR01784 family)
MTEYEESLKVYRDLKGAVETTYEDGRIDGRIEGIEKGIEKGIKKMAQELLKHGVPPDVIAKSSGLTAAEVSKLSAGKQ